MQKANLNLLFNLLSDIGVRNVQKEKEILIDSMCSQSVGIDFAGYHLYKQQKVAWKTEKNIVQILNENVI